MIYVLDMASFKDAKSFDTARSSLMQFVSFFVDPVWLSIDVYYGYNVTELQSPIVLMDYDTKIELLEKISELKYVGSISDKFGEALEKAQTRAYSGQDVIILTAVQTFSSLSTWVKSYQENKVNAHLVHFGVSTTKVDIAQLTRYGSSNFVPNVINNRAMSAYSWAVNTLQSFYEKTRTHRAKIFEQSIIQNSSSDVNKTGTFYLDSPASRLLVSLYYLDNENEAINISLHLPWNLRLNHFLRVCNAPRSRIAPRCLLAPPLPAMATTSAYVTAVTSTPATHVTSRDSHWNAIHRKRRRCTLTRRSAQDTGPAQPARWSSSTKAL
ncbi:hypothetical protein DAPPUDRAFT_242475, partial [Daphnia pulex]